MNRRRWHLAVLAVIGRVELRTRAKILRAMVRCQKFSHLLLIRLSSTLMGPYLIFSACKISSGSRTIRKERDYVVKKVAFVNKLESK